jgi:hypothetical protein
LQHQLLVDGIKLRPLYLYLWKVSFLRLLLLLVGAQQLNPLLKAGIRLRLSL